MAAASSFVQPCGTQMPHFKVENLGRKWLGCKQTMKRAQNRIIYEHEEDELSLIILTSSNRLRSKFRPCIRCTANFISSSLARMSTLAKQYLPFIFSDWSSFKITLVRMSVQRSKSPNWLALPRSKPDGIFELASNTKSRISERRKQRRN